MNKLHFGKQKLLLGIKPDLSSNISDRQICRLLFNEDRGNVVYDICNNYKSVTLNGNYTWNNVRPGNGLYLAGTDDYINLGKTVQKYIDFWKPFSINYWVTLPVAGNGAWRELSGTYISNAGSWEYLMLPRLLSSKWDFVMYLQVPARGFQVSTTNTVPMVNNKMHLMTITYDGTQSSTSTKMYLDGVSLPTTHGYNGGASSDTLWQPGRLASLDLIIGGSRRTASIDNDLEMYIHQYIFHARVLSDNEVKNLADNPFLGLQVNSKHAFSMSAASGWTPHDPMGTGGIFGM